MRMPRDEVSNLEICASIILAPEVEQFIQYDRISIRMSRYQSVYFMSPVYIHAKLACRRLWVGHNRTNFHIHNLLSFLSTRCCVPTPIIAHRKYIRGDHVPFGSWNTWQVSLNSQTT